MPDIIGQYSQKFAMASERIRAAIVSKYIEFYKKGMSNPEAFRKFILSRDVATEIIDTLGLGDLHESLVDSYYAVAAGVVPAAMRIPESIISALAKIDTMEFYNHVRDVGTELQKQLFNASIGGLSENKIAMKLENATKLLSEAQVNALTNTSLATVSRATFAEVAKDDPPETCYIYIGPEDERNRPECAEVLEDPRNKSMGFTRDEIDDLPVDFIFGGGFNCRHEWAGAISEEAKAVMEEREKAWGT